MARYVWKTDGFYNPATGERMEVPERDGVCLPRVQRDLAGFTSPIDGTWVEGHAARREHMRKHNVVDVGDRKPREPKDEQKIRRYTARG